MVLGAEWTSHGSPENIQHFVVTAEKHKHLEVVRRILFADPLPSAVIIFVNDQHRAGVVASKLREFKLKVTYMQGNQTKLERSQVMKEFRERKYPILVCTEVLARGMDFPFVSHVIQLELPTDAQHYLHRAGRCGRAGVQGFCFSIVSPEYLFVMKKFSKSLKISIHPVQVKNNKLFTQGKQRVLEFSNRLPPSRMHQDEYLPSASELEAQFDQLVKELEEAETWEDVGGVDGFLEVVAEEEQKENTLVSEARKKKKQIPKHSNRKVS